MYFILLFPGTRAQIRNLPQKSPCSFSYAQTSIRFFKKNLLFFFFFSCLNAVAISKATVFSSWFGHDVAWSAMCHLPAWWVFGPTLFPYMACSSGRHSILHILLFFPLLFKILLSSRRRKHKTQGVMPPSTALLSQLEVHGCKPSHQILVESPRTTKKPQRNIKKKPQNTQ